MFTSIYRGVTRHRLTGRFEAHFWDSSYVRPNAVSAAARRACSSSPRNDCMQPGPLHDSNICPCLTSFITAVPIPPA